MTSLLQAVWVSLWATEERRCGVRRGLCVMGLLGMAAAAVAAAKPPDISKLITDADLQAALGPGFAVVPNSCAATSEVSSCLYRRGKESAAVSVIGSPDDNATAALKAQSAGQFRATDRTAKALPELGEGAFAIVLKSGTKMSLFAPKGALRINVEVYGPGRKPDPEAAAKLAKVVQSKLP